MDRAAIVITLGETRAKYARLVYRRCCTSSPGHDFSLYRHSSADGFDLGPAKGREAVHDGDADLDFGGLAVGIS